MTDIEKDHNDEKVMREVKSISGEGHQKPKVQQESKQRRYGPPGT